MSDEQACAICGESEPRTGTCGSSDPNALCNRTTVAGGLTPYASINGEKCYRGIEVDALLTSFHRQLAGEKLRADQGWERAEAKSRECIELRERIAATSASVSAPAQAN